MAWYHIPNYSNQLRRREGHSSYCIAHCHAEVVRVKDAYKVGSPLQRQIWSKPIASELPVGRDSENAKRSRSLRVTSALQCAVRTPRQYPE